MLLNEVKKDIAELCAAEHTSKAAIGRTLGITRQTVDSCLDTTIVTRGFLELCEAIGYDVEIHYVKR